MALDFITRETEKNPDNIEQNNKRTYMTSTLGADSTVQGVALEAMKHNFMMRNNCFIRKGVPESHKRAADNFMIIRKIFGQPVVQPKMSDEEKALLVKYDFNPLELSTSRQIEDELLFLKKWSYSRNRELQEAADTIIKIRVKELKYHIATRFVNIKKDFDGYKILEKYLEEISKYM